MFIKRTLILSCVFAQSLLCVHGVTYPSGGDGNGTANNPKFGLLEDQLLTIYLDGNLSGSSSDSFSDWNIKSAPPASHGSIPSGIQNHNATSFKFTFTPATNFEGNATFQLESRQYATDINSTHNFTVVMSSSNDDPVLKFNNGSGGNFGSDAAYQIAENQTIAGFLYVKEFDATDDVNITLDSTQLDNQAFGQPVRDLSYSPPDPDFPNEKKYNLSFLAAKDYESNSVLSRNFQYKLKVWARDGNGGDVNQTLTITITPLNEAPGISPTGQVDFAITEDKSGNVDGSFYRQKSGYVNISVVEKDRYDNSVILNLSNSPTRGKVYYSTSDPGSTPPVTQLTGSQVSLTTGQIWVDYRPDGNQTGSDNFIVRFADEDDVTKYSQLIFNGSITSVTNDPPKFSDSLASPYTISFEEEQVNSVAIIDLNATDGDPEHTEGGTAPNGDLRFEVLGTDKDLFDISTSGVLTFKNKMSFEDKSDSNNDNIFNITVRVTDPTSISTDSTTYDELSLIVNLTDKNEQPVIIQGASFQNSFTIQEGGSWNLPTNWLSASDVDDNDNASLQWSIQFSQGGSVSGGAVGGTHASPSFTYVPLADFPNLSTGDGSETLTIQVADHNGFSSSPLTVTARITALPDAPQVSRLQRGSERVDINSTNQRVTFQYPENSAAADPIRIYVNEVDGEAVSFSLLDAGNLDVNQFVIADENQSSSPYTATINFKNSFVPDYEDPNDSNYDNNYSFRIRAFETNNTNSFDDIFVDILITDQDEAPVIVKPDPVDLDSRNDTYLDFNITVDENKKFISLLKYKDPDKADENKSFVWTLAGGVDEDNFDINGTTGALSFKDNLGVAGQVGINFENKLDLDLNNTYEVEIRLIDPSGGGSAKKNFHIKTRDINDPPVVAGRVLSLLEPAKTNPTFELSQYVVDEDNASGTPDNVTWSLKSSSSVFSLDQNGSLSFQAPSDYESNQTVFNLPVQAYDGTVYVDANYTIQVNPSNEPPVFYDDLNNTITFKNFTTPEEIPISINLSQFAKDPEKDAITYSHNYNNADGEIKFFNPSDGNFTFIPKANFSNIVVLDFNATDPANNKKAFKVNITVTEVADPPVVYKTGTPIQLGYPNLFQIGNFRENNGTLVAELNASDPNDNPSSTSFTWSLSGTDASKFTMNPSSGSVSQLKFLQVPDYENPIDSNKDNEYDFNMTVMDEGNATTVPVRITVINGEEDPYFVYGDGNQTVTFTEESAGVVFEINATDHDGSSIIYGKTGNGPDDSNFTVHPITGQVTFNSPPDYEVPWGGADSNKSNTYILEVNATDNTGSTNKIRHYVIVNVSNVIEPPSFVKSSPRTTSIGENNTGTGAFYDIQVDTNDTNQTLILEISGGADRDKFSLNVVTNNLHFSNPNGQDFENPASADGDNDYEVQVRIKDTNVTQDLTYKVTDRNDTPIISSTGLTQITLPENVPLAIDIDVLDQDGGGRFPDILFTVDNNSTRFIEHNASGLALSNLFINPSSGMVDNSLSNAVFSTAGDLNNDGDLDIVTLSTSAIYYHEGNGTGSFDRNTTTYIDSNGSGTPDHAIICDLDQDGDQDLIVSLFSDSKVMFYENDNPVGIFSSPVALVRDRVGGGADFISVGDMDGDYDLDLIVAYQSSNEVVWYANDGSTNFSLGGVVASTANGLSQPRYLELLDVNSSSAIGNRFQSPDILIAAKGGIYLAANDGKGNFSVSEIAEIGSDNGLVVRAVNLDGNQWPDLVYATSATSPPSYLLQGATGYAASPQTLPTNKVNRSWTVDTPTAIEIYTGPSIPPPNYTGPSPSTPAIIVSDSALPYMSIFTTAPNIGTGVLVADPVVLNVPMGISSIMLADLNRKTNFISYAFDPLISADFNNTRFKNEGMLFFNYPYPNYEQPTDSSKINRYKVWVTATDSTGLIAKELVTVKILDVNEAPVISTLDGNDTGIIDHVENLTAVIDVNVTHEENATQTVSFSIIGGADQSKFDINSSTGQLVFRNAPDFENPQDADLDTNKTYEVTIRATDNGLGNAFDQQHIKVRLKNGSEPPEFSTAIQTNISVSEDGSLPLLFGSDINATDSNGAGNQIEGYRVLTNGIYGNATITGTVGSPPINFTYVPDGNFTGSDVVVLEVNNTAGLKDTLTLNVTVTPVDDPPSIQTPAIINHPENRGHVIALSAVDDNNVTLNWSWAAGTPPSNFKLTSDGNLTFRQIPDYEKATNNNTYSNVIRVSDGVSTVDRNFTINVYNLNDNPPLSTFLTANASSSFSLVENNSIVVDLNASDADNSIVSNFNTITYSITGGADKLRFDVSNAGRLQLLPAPDYENPNSADLDNIYMVELTLSDGGYSKVYPIVVTVSDADENNPTITSNGGLGTASHTHPENQLAVLQVVASDIEPKPLVYSISGGQDPNLFKINSQSGHLSFVTAPNFELPSDGDANNLYEVWVRATDEGNTSDEQRINISVTDVDELPTVSPSLFSTTEDVAIPVNFTVADPEGGTATFSVITPPVNGKWTGSGNNFTFTPNANYFGTDSVTLRVSDGTSQFDTLVNLEINATNDPPTAVNDEFFYNDSNFGILGLDVLANDSNSPDQNGTETLSITSFTQPNDGNVSLALGASSLSFTPSTSFIGITTFNYTVSDGSLESNGTVEIVVSRAASLPSWRFLKKFGFYNQTAKDWIYHNDLGWLYLEDVTGVETYTWMWHEDMGWFWTGNTYFPDLYLNDLARWMSWKGSRTTGNSWTIYDQADKVWLDSEKFKVARLNTIFTQLKNVDQVMEFVNSSPLFTDEERQTIATEFFFNGKSSTLSSKGFTLAF